MDLPENLKTRKIRRKNLRSDPSYKQRVEPTKKKRLNDQNEKEAEQEIKQWK